jgi:hypothetical protein
MWLVRYYMHGKKGEDQKFMEYNCRNEEKYPRSEVKEMDKAGESSRKDVSAIRQHQQARGCSKITGETRSDPAVNMSKIWLVSELFLREKKRAK